MNHTEEHIEESHEGPIKTPKQLIVTVILAFIVPVIIIFLIIRLVVSSDLVGAGSDAQTPEAIASRIKPVANFVLVDANAPKVLKTGKQVFESTCTACHGAGVAGAPKVGDKEAWKPYIAQGYDTMVKYALSGKNAMPPKGGNPSLDDIEVARAVAYMANQSGASFKEPEAPAADAKKDDKAQAAAPTQMAAAEPAKAEAKPEAKADKAPAKAQAAAAPAAKVDPAGEKLYNAVCFSCHNTGLAGAPKLGNKADWEPRIATGIDTLVKVAISGKGAMPPRGGTQASDDEIRAVVEYMVSKVQ